MLLLIALALAERPLPDYRDELQAAAAAEISQLASTKGPDAAEEASHRWTRAIGDDARIAYEVGLAWRLAGNESKAARQLDLAVQLDPDFVAARYDRGEVRLNREDLEGATEDFEVVVRLAPSEWAGHFRLADIAARRRDANGFKAHLLEALRCGFDLKLVVQDPRWHRYLADPELGPVLRTLVLVYQDEALLQTLEQPPE